MTSRRGTSVDEVEAFVAEVAGWAGCAVPEVQWADRRDGKACLRDGRPVLELGYGIPTDVEDARFTAAHEVGHIALGHLTSDRRLAAQLMGPSLLLLITGLVAEVAAPQAVRAVALMAAIVAALVAIPVMTRIFKYPQEIVADHFAAQQGAPLTARLVRRYETQKREHPGSVLARVMNA